VALSLYFPGLPPALLDMNGAEIVVLLGLKCSWNKQPGAVQNVTGWNVSSSPRALWSPATNLGRM